MFELLILLGKARIIQLFSNLNLYRGEVDEKNKRDFDTRLVFALQKQYDSFHSSTDREMSWTWAFVEVDKASPSISLVYTSSTVAM